MMILLSKAEYNELLKRAGNVDVLVEEKMAVEREALYARLRRIATDDRSFVMNPEAAIRRFMAELSK